MRPRSIRPLDETDGLRVRGQQPGLPSMVDSGGQHQYRAERENNYTITVTVTVRRKHGRKRVEVNERKQKK